MSSDGSEFLIIGMIGIFFLYEFTDVLNPLKEKAGLPQTFGLKEMLASGGGVGVSAINGDMGGGAATGPVNSGGLSTAASIASSKSMTIPATFGGAVILIPNEGHHGPGTKDCLSPSNCEYLPKKLIAPAGINISWLSDDAGHDHTVVVSGGKSTPVIKTDTASPVINFPTPGKFTYKDKAFPEAGDIEITAGKAGGKGTAGAVFCPAGEVEAYTSMIKGLGMSVTSSAPDGSKVAIIVYTSPLGPAETAGKLSAVTKKTPWT